MLNPAIAQYIAADRAAETRRDAARARQATAESRQPRAARRSAGSGAWRRTQPWIVTPRANVSIRLLPR